MRRGFFLAGLAALALVWAAPLEAWLGAFPVHMLRHMTLVAIAAPLLALGLGPALAPFAVQPVLAAAVEFAVVWAWHLPAVHGAAYLTGAGFAAEQAMFLAAGLLVWAGALSARQPLAGALGLLLTSMHMTLLGALLILAPRDLYAAICGYPPDLAGQQTGGLLMLAIGTPAYLLGGLWLVRRAIGDEAPA